MTPPVLQPAASALRARVRRRWQEWIHRRIPPSPEVTLSQKNIFIFPSASGFAFLLLLLALLLTAINYENNLVFALTFLLGALFVVAVLHTYANLAGLEISVGHCHAVFVGEEAGFPVTLRDVAARPHDGIFLNWPGSERCRARVPPTGEDCQVLFVRTQRRGPLYPGRLLLQSWYPLGLIRAWSWVDLEARCVVYPAPGPPQPMPKKGGGGEEGFAVDEPGVEDFSGFRNYAPGDPLRHVAWKTLAKGQPLQTREYVAFSDRQQWLDWERTAAFGSVEQRLSVLCRWILELDRIQAEYGLSLPAARFAPASGDAQRERCLHALAMFGFETAVSAP
jgi:uncharacterized protein (DUF58 family)